jgi:hypothetical protein
MAKSLPALEQTARVYIIGHPGGRDLAFSFQDNELLDHEGPSAGKPQIPGVCRVHYRAPTEGGSSGSPVFNARLWEVIALHHNGGKIGMPSSTACRENTRPMRGSGSSRSRRRSPSAEASNSVIRGYGPRRARGVYCQERPANSMRFR